MSNSRITVIHNYIILIALLSISFYSCNQTPKSELTEKSEKQTKEKAISDSIRLHSLYTKFDEKHKLNDQDFDFIFNFNYLQHADVSEGVGNYLFEYLHKNPETNQELRTYLHKQDKQKGSDYITIMIEIMYIDISFEYKDFNSFQKDFHFVTYNQQQARKTFEHFKKINSSSN